MAVISSKDINNVNTSPAGSTPLASHFFPFIWEFEVNMDLLIMLEARVIPEQYLEANCGKTCGTMMQSFEHMYQQLG